MQRQNDEEQPLDIYGITPHFIRIQDIHFIARQSLLNAATLKSRVVSFFTGAPQENPTVRWVTGQMILYNPQGLHTPGQIWRDFIGFYKCLPDHESELANLMRKMFEKAFQCSLMTQRIKEYHRNRYGAVPIYVDYTTEEVADSMSAILNGKQHPSPTPQRRLASC